MSQFIMDKAAKDFTEKYLWKLEKVGVTKLKVWLDFWPSNADPRINDWIFSARIWKGDDPKRTTNCGVRLRRDWTFDYALEDAFIRVYTTLYLMASEDKEGIKKL
jgi:hypothetical protein